MQTPKKWGIVFFQKLKLFFNKGNFFYKQKFFFQKGTLRGGNSLAICKKL